MPLPSDAPACGEYNGGCLSLPAAGIGARTLPATAAIGWEKISRTRATGRQSIS